MVCVTKQNQENAHYTFTWLHNHGVYFPEYHITDQKYCLNLDYLVDDAPENYEQWVEHGNKEKNFFLRDASYNRYMDVSNRVTNFDEIITVLNKRERLAKFI